MEMAFERTVRTIGLSHGRAIRFLAESINESVRVAKSSGIDAANAVARRSDGTKFDSIDSSDVEVSISFRISDPSDLGTFRSTNNFQIELGIRGNSLVDSSRSGLPSVAEILLHEQIGWAISSLGHFADYAYKVTSAVDTFELRTALFVVLLDGEGNPQLAPEDFRWDRLITRGRSARPLKLPPARENQSLRERIISRGDTVPVDGSVGVGANTDDQIWVQQVFTRVITSATRSPDAQDFHIKFTRVSIIEEVQIEFVYSMYDRGARERRNHGLRVNGPSLRKKLVEDSGNGRPEFAAEIVLRSLSPMTNSYYRAPVVDGISWVSMP
ncbi:hypothetical protein LQ384_25210 [Rhodococcus rhodochrous]|uniref:Uncharacterized protein n=1 Tax=Rhodococcus rhodochrous TaxID=1829 RepID=A0AAW4XL29_RHORH|nr:hypothetical protein [Rhodococcus rhodochrous]MCD2114413.1 hypothetical protein [Rhodococcus rhodochrous]